MEKSEIKKKLNDIVNTYLESKYDFDKMDDEHTALQLISSHSIQSIEFVILLESEFEIEFEDEEIDIDFFKSTDTIVSLIYTHMCCGNEK